MNLKAYSNILATDKPALISLGEKNIGKSTLLKQLFYCDFE